MYMQGFTYGGQLISLGFTLTVFGMILWFRDIITEGTKNFNYPLSFDRFVYSAKVTTKSKIEIFLFRFIEKTKHTT